MKKCSRCSETKNREDFNRSSRNKDGLHGYCRKCSKSHYATNKERHSARIKVRRNEQAKRLREIMFSALADGCIDCRELNIVVLEFDHIDPSRKTENVSTMYRKGVSEKKIIDEISKCAVRCANCHRIRTDSQNPSWKSKYAFVSALVSTELKP